MVRDQIFFWLFALPLGILLWVSIAIVIVVLASAAIETWRGK